MKKENENQFAKEVVSLIDTTKNSNETYQANIKGYDYFTETGLKSFDILPNSFLEIKFLFDSNFETFRKIYLQCVSFLNMSDASIVLICNLTSSVVDRYIKKLDAHDRFKVISIDDLNNIEFDSSRYKKRPKSFERFPRFEKTISFERFIDFLLSLVRVNILGYAFPEGRGSTERIIVQKDDILPFAFCDGSDKWHVFIWEKSRYTKKSILFQDNAIVHKVGVDSKDGKMKLRIDGKEFDFQKISKALLGQHIALFNSQSSCDMVPQDLQYKYRAFGCSSEDEFDENNIGTYVKKVIEDNEIYFSTKKQLNDPFDLDTEVFGYDAILTASDYRVFCVTGKNDNILMWSHYGDSHSGYCTAYQPIDIITAIEKSPDIDFCVCGGVNYKNNRKASNKDLLSLIDYFDNDTASLTLQILQLFKKYKDWSYEEEFRYIISLKEVKKIANTPTTSKEAGLALVTIPKDYYFGYCFEFNAKTKPYLLKYIGKDCYSFDLSKTDYKLLIKTIDLSR